MRLLITGAAGMLGADVLAAATTAGHEAATFSHAQLDITDGAAVERAISSQRPDAVINCAACTDVDGAEACPDAAFAVNGGGAGEVARAVARAGALIVHISSDYVFAGDKRQPYVESDPVAPLSVYGKSKLAGELAVAQAAPQSHTIVRSSWLFGSHGQCFPATILRLAAERNELDVVDDQVGCPTFTGHLAQALLEIAAKPPVGTMHVAGAGECSWYEFASAIVEEAGLQCEVKPARTADMARPAPRPAYSVLGSERSEAPRLPEWRQGLGAYLAARAGDKTAVGTE
jgi:dTDP-4-dehydrorhamnose reductase